MDDDADTAGLHTARLIADDVLFPAASAVDAADRVPPSHLDLLADRGMYGLAAPDDLNRLDLPDFPAVLRLVEILAGGCLTTTFVWMQHHGAVIALDTTDNLALRTTYLSALAQGRRRAGMAIGAAVKPGPPALRAEPVADGYLFDGYAPWVTGWDMIDTLYTAGRDPDDQLVFALLDVQESETLQIEPLQLSAVQASRTVTVRFSRHFVPSDRVTGTMSQAQHRSSDHESLRFTGSLSVGASERAIGLLGDDAGALPDELGAARRFLLEAAPEEVPAARAACAELAVRAATALAVHDGAGSILAGATPQRLVREATFLLLFGSRPAIRTSLLGRLTVAQSREAPRPWPRPPERRGARRSGGP